MSRSVRRNPHAKCVRTKKPGRKSANRKLRRRMNRSTEYEIGNNNSYRKHTEKWDICDYESSLSFNEYIESRKKWTGKREFTPEEMDDLYWNWYKDYKLK